MEKIKGKNYLTAYEIVKQTRNGYYASLLTLIKNGFIDGATHSNENKTSWLIPESIAKDYIYIIDHKQEILNAIKVRAKYVTKKYDISNSQICKSADVDISLLSKIINNKVNNITYRTIYKLCKKSSGLRCKISTLVKIAKDNSNQIESTDLTCTTDEYEKNIINLERVIKEQQDSISWLQSEIDRLKFITKVSKRKLKKFNKINNEK